MAYFNHAFRKCFVISSLETAGTGSTADLNAGQLGTAGEDWNLTAAAARVPSQGHFYLVQGSYHTVDTIGNNPGHGGYSESVKSKGINPKYISRLWKTPVCTPTPATAQVQLASDCVPCGSSIFLRMDVKGSPALRFLNHNAYAIGDSANVCCVDGQDYIDPAAALAEAGRQLLADPILSPFARERQYGSGAAAIKAGVSVTKTAGGLNGLATIAGGPTGSGFVNGDFVKLVDAATGVDAVAEVTNAVAGAIQAGGLTVVAAGRGFTVASALTVTVLTGSGTAATGLTVGTVSANSATYSIAQVQGATYVESTDPVGDGVSATLHVEGAYVDTKFGNCSFDTRDHYEKEPVQIILSNLDETGEPCNDCGVASRTTGVMAQTSGETVLRDVLMTERYMQMPYNQGNPDSARIREIEHSDDILDAVDRDARYVSYNLLHSVPRFNNPTGVFDNDQYLITIYVKSDETTLISNMDALFTEIETASDVNFDDTTDVCGSACTIS